jgi:hypothetical protein
MLSQAGSLYRKIPKFRAYASQARRRKDAESHRMRDAWRVAE